MNELKTYEVWAAKAVVLSIFLVGCVMGDGEEYEMMESMEGYDPISHECFMKENSFESIFVHGETDESHTGKSDDGQSESETKKSGVEAAAPEGLDAIDCQKRQEFEMDGRQMGECSPEERSHGHGSPQPLDPTDPEDDDSDSDGENGS